MNILSNRLFLFSVAVTFAGAAGVVAKRKRRRGVVALMKARHGAPVPFGEHFAYLADPSVAEHLRLIFEQTLRVDLSNLLPTDRLGIDLGLDRGGQHELLKLLYAIEERFDVVLPCAARCLAMSFGRLAEFVDRGVAAGMRTEKRYVEGAGSAGAG